MSGENQEALEDQVTDTEEFEIEEVDDTPPEDQKYANAKAPEASEEEQEEEDKDRERYSKRIKNRIDRLTFEKNQGRRQAEAAERERDEAVEYARQMQQRYTTMQQQMAQGEKLLYDEAGGRVNAEIDAAKRELREAMDNGDNEKAVEAQARLGDLSARKSRIDTWRPRQQAPQQHPQQSAPEQFQQPQPQQPQQKPVGPSDKALAWKDQNEWYGVDSKMTAIAMAEHDSIVREGKVAPDSDEYYRQIDESVRKVFPQYFSEEEEEKPANVVAAPGRTTGNKPRKTVRLSKTQLAVAKRLGVTPQQYAAELMKNEGK